VVDLEGNSKPIEQIQVGEMVLARSEFEPNGPLELKRVEELFTRTSPIIELEIGGQKIGTTDEHPFYVPAREAFVPARELQVGDQLISHDGRLLRIDAIHATLQIATVYNLRVVDYHTYFVGCDEWGFSVWAHNACVGKDVQDGLAAVGLKKTNNPTAKKLAQMANDTAITSDQLVTEIQRLRPGANKYQASWLADNMHVRAGRPVGTHPETYLQEALRQQGLTAPPAGLKQKWNDGTSNYEVRVHAADPAHGKTGSVYRVERHRLGTDPVTGQGFGREYLDHNGVWHHTSTLKPGIAPSLNPYFNATAASDTHIQL
jgi:hypothetical protein